MNGEMNRRTTGFLLIVAAVLALAAGSALADGLSSLYLPIDKVSIEDSSLKFDVNDIIADTGQAANIEINLEYGKGEGYDPDNDGIEAISGVVDFTVANTVFIGSINTEKLCTRWEVFSHDNMESNILCYGNMECCNFIGLGEASKRWDDNFFMYFGGYGATKNNTIRAQVLHVDYSLDESQPYSYIYYSKFQSLDAIFSDEMPLPIEANIKEVNYMPYLAGDTSIKGNSTPSINITSPSGAEASLSGEDVYLNFSAETMVYAGYSLDNGAFVSLGNGTSFSSIIMSGRPYGVVGNGMHTVTVFASATEGNYSVFNRSFSVNDTAAPFMVVNISNSSSLQSKYFVLPIKVTTNEYSAVGHWVNAGSYSGNMSIGKNADISLAVNDGQNNISINCSDFNGNYQVHTFSVNFSEAGNCSDARRNGDEEGIDCGGMCQPCINLSVSTSRTGYNITDNVFLTVVSRSASSVNVTVARENTVCYRYQFIPVFSGAPISETRLMQNISSQGNYTVNAVMSYLNITETSSVAFYLAGQTSNELYGSINANATTINEGDAIAFSASVYGNSGAVTYKWDFENDRTIDNTTANPTRTFNTNGTYAVNLTVSDGKWNTTIMQNIVVRKLFNVTVIAYDNATRGLITGAMVSIGESEGNTSSSGIAVLTKPAGDYTLLCTKEGYIRYAQRIEMERSFTAYVNLTQEDNSAPVISVIYPGTGLNMTESSIRMSFKAADRQRMSCRLYVAEEGSSFWQIKATNASVNPDELSWFDVAGLKNATYEWKIECTDQSQNSNFSEERAFTVDTSLAAENPAEFQEADKSTEDIVNQINEVIASIDSMQSKEKDIALALDLRKELEKAIITIQRGNRDLHSLKWRRLNESGLEEEKKNIQERMDNVRNTTPKSIRVVESSEFVKYPDNNDLEGLILVLLNQSNTKYSKRELKALVEANRKLQAMLTATTKAAIVEMEYLAGNRETITVVQKSLRISGNLSQGKFYEVIPKDVAKDISEIEMLFEYEVISSDPVFSIDTQKFTSYSYYVRKRASLKDIEGIRSLLVGKELKAKRSSAISGFAVLDSLAASLTDEADIRLLVEITIIVILAAIYLMYSFGGFERLRHITESKNLKEIKALIEEADSLAKNNDYDGSSAKYRDITQRIGHFSDKEKTAVKGLVTELGNRINMVFINSLVNEANCCIDAKDKKKAFANYSKVQSLYKIVPKSYKAEVLKKCIELHTRLAG